MQLQISSAKSYCKLAAKQPIFETSQSCVSTTATLSHRFKSSPAIPGKLAVPGAAGYMMNAGHFRKSYVSSGDLNRPRESRGSQPSISLKHGRLAHVRSQFSLFRRSPTHKNLPQATFCTSEQLLWAAMPPFCVACGGLFLLFVKYKKWGKKLCNFPFGKFVPSETAHAAYFYLHSTRKPCKKT